MLCHESIESYYRNNFAVMFHSTGKFNINNNFTLDDVENMLPYEREIYFAMIQNEIKELQDNNKGK